MSFTCPLCRRTSYHPMDEQEGYCGACHAFTRELVSMPATLGASHAIFGPMYAAPRELPDGRIAYVCPLTYGRARINVGDLSGVDDGY